MAQVHGPCTQLKQKTAALEIAHRRLGIMKLTALVAATLFLLATAPTGAHAGLFGLLGYGACQSGCNALAVACYAAGGATFGTVTAGAGVPAVILGCNAALGTCMAACATVALSPV
jgi:hypothetical protein